MIWILLFLAGALLCNAIPHLAAGLRGEPFPTPFARPRGVGQSSPTVNFLWGTVNLAAGTALLLWRLPQVDRGLGLIAATAGWLAIGLYLARHFGAVRAGRGLNALSRFDDAAMVGIGTQNRGKSQMTEAAIEPPEFEEMNHDEAIARLRGQQNFALAVPAGIAAALVGAILWAVVVYVSGYALGLMAIVVGAIVGYAVRATGKGVDRKFGILGAACAALGWALGTA